jgi:hypothetical protein
MQPVACGNDNKRSKGNRKSRFSAGMTTKKQEQRAKGKGNGKLLGVGLVAWGRAIF